MEPTIETPAQRLAAYHAQKSRCDSALDDCGIGHDAPELLGKQLREIATICADLTGRASARAAHNLFANAPQGIVRRADCTAAKAVRDGLVGFSGSLVRWDIRAAMELAADILEDVNAHAEAAELRRWADKPLPCMDRVQPEPETEIIDFRPNGQS